MNVKVKDIEVKHNQRLEKIKELKAKTVTQIKELDFSNLEHTQKIRVALTAGGAF